MTPAAFRSSLTNSVPPPDLSAPLRALWCAEKGDWQRAHKLVQDEESRAAAAVHAYLHRVEGDLGNARYWYGQAGRAAATGALAAEWSALVAAFLTSAPAL